MALFVKTRGIGGIAAVLAVLPSGSSAARADVVCVRATNKVVKGKVVTSLSRVTRSTTCNSGEVLALTGPAGADGQLRVYGDGSAGDLVVNSSGDLFSQYAADGNTQFSSLTVLGAFVAPHHFGLLAPH